MNLFPRGLDHCSNFPTSPTPRANGPWSSPPDEPLQKWARDDDHAGQEEHDPEEGKNIHPELLLQKQRTDVKDKYSGNRDFYTKIYGVSAFRVKCPLDQFWDTSSILEPIPFFFVFCAG